MVVHRSPEAKKRKVPASQAEATNGPSAKKAKTSKESSSSEESSSEDEKPTKAAPAGNINMLMSQSEIFTSVIGACFSKMSL